MWILSASLAWSEPSMVDGTLSSRDVHAAMDTAMNSAMGPITKRRSNTPNGIPCPKDVCTRLNHASQEAYRQAMMDTDWLSMANRYKVGTSLLPDPESTEPRRFLHWNTDDRDLWMLMDSGTATAFYATWSFTALSPVGNPFDPNRLEPLNRTREAWLDTCKQTRPIDIDVRQNETAWSGTDCNGWDLWFEYRPESENALYMVAVKR